MNSVAQKLLATPTEIQQLVESDALTQVLHTICAEHDIPESWSGELIRGTIRILCGEMKPADFIDFIMREYWVEEEEALSIAQKINLRIFSLVKPQLALVHNISDQNLAHRVKVPKKPKESTEHIEIPATQPKEAPSPYMVTTPQNSETAQRVPQEHTPRSTPQPETKPSIQTSLSSKLSGQTKDPYREF